MDKLNQQASVPQTLGKSHGSKMMLFIFGAVIILIGLGGYLLGANKAHAPVANNAFPQSSVSPTDETANPDSIGANWKTYIGKDFSFKYPSNGHVATESSSLVYISYEDGTKPYFTFTVNIADNLNHLTTKQVVDKMVDDLRSNKYAPWAKSQADQTLQTMKEYANGQITGIKLQSFDEGYPQKFGEVVEVRENKIFKFYIGDGSGGGVGDNDEKRLDQILSTFKFTQ